MNFFDLHCDTLYECVSKEKNLKENDFIISIKKGKCFDEWIQCFAVWIPDDKSLTYSKKNFVFNIIDFFNKEMFKNPKVKPCFCSDDLRTKNKIKAILTIEGLCFIEEVSEIETLYKKGVRVAALTWNESNKIGDGSGVKNACGLTEFGKSILKKIMELNIIIDVSHASDALFYDVINFVKNPIIATHSNSRKICPHKRNLTDDQFLKIKNSSGIVGLNFYKDFLNDKKHATFDDIMLHAEHFLSLGGEKVLSIGSDFDGVLKEELPKEMENLSCVLKLYEKFLRKFDEKVVKDIFFGNAYNFFLKNL